MTSDWRGTVQHVKRLSDRDLQKIFFEYLHFLPDRLGLLELEYKTIRPTRIKICIYKMLCDSFPMNKNLYPLASLVGEKKETLLFTSPNVTELFKFIRKRNRMDGMDYLLIPHFASTFVDTAKAVYFYRHSTFRSKELMLELYKEWQQIAVVTGGSSGSRLVSAPPTKPNRKAQ